MDRRQFIKGSAVLTAAGVISPSILTAGIPDSKAESTPGKKPLITSAPMLQNFSESSIGIAFSVSDMANGFVNISENADMSGSRTVKCGGYRVTDMNDKVMLVRVTGLKPATKYYYTIGADRISYLGGYQMKKLDTETDSRVYSFTTAGKNAYGHFCVINDTHANWQPFGISLDKIASIAPACVIWNGDASNCEEHIDNLVNIYLEPAVERRDYASEIPYLFCPGNHDSRGMANRHLEKVWMYRQPEERSPRDWDLGRNFAVRLGDIALIGLDTAEDKMDSNPLFAGLFNSSEYRKAQALWLKDVLKRKDIASAPFLVAFCHIPIFDDDPTNNPGDIYPDDKAPGYSADFAYWQRECGNLWGPLLDKAKCQLVITAHMHEYRFDAPAKGRSWAQIVGGGPHLGSKKNFPTVVEGKVEDGKLNLYIHNISTGEVVDKYSFSRR